jgi:hypothetical protein
MSIATAFEFRRQKKKKKRFYDHRYARLSRLNLGEGKRKDAERLWAERKWSSEIGDRRVIEDKAKKE